MRRALRDASGCPRRRWFESLAWFSEFADSRPNRRYLGNAYDEERYGYVLAGERDSSW